MLTVDYDRLHVGPGDRVLDLGCGAGRHAYGALRRGADVVALDWSEDEVAVVRDTMAAMDVAGEVPPGVSMTAVRGDLTALPFPDATFDKVIAAEVLEHIPADSSAMAEIAPISAIAELSAGMCSSTSAAITLSNVASGNGSAVRSPRTAVIDTPGGTSPATSIAAIVSRTTATSSSDQSRATTSAPRRSAPYA